MDTSTSAMDDPLIEAPTLPELSFDDLLGESPVKRNASSLDDPLELEEQERKESDDDTLHTPRPKKVLLPQIKTTATGIGLAFGVGPAASAGNQRAAAAATTTATKTATVAATPATTTATGQLGKVGATAPVLLNSRNLLPKSSTATTQLLKITTKLPAKPGPATGSAVIPAAATATIGAEMGGKTAVKTANGQTWYIQKTTAGLSAVRLQATTAANTSTAATTTTVATGASATTAMSASTTAAGSKTVAIQVLCAGGATAKNSLALPSNVATQLSGKRIISASGGQVLLKPLRPLTATTAAAVTTTTTSAATAAPTTVSKAIGLTTTAARDVTAAKETTNVTTTTTTGVKLQRIAPTPAGAATITTASGVQPVKAAGGIGGGTGAGGGGKIVVQSANGKQIVVSNQHLIKLSPKRPADGAAGGGGQLQAVQLAGKPLQYVRVMSNSRLGGGGGTASSTVAPTATTSATSSGSPTTSAIKIVGAGAAPQKFTMVRPNVTTAKTLLTQSPRKDGGVPVTFSPLTSKVQKTIVTVPTLRTIADGPSGTSSNSSGSNNTSTNSLLRSVAAPGTTASASSLVGKHKISEINSEIQRITGSGGSGGSGSTESGSVCPPETKKVAGGSRIVVVSRSMLRTNAGGAAQQVTVQGAGNAHNSSNNNNNGKHGSSQYSHNANNNTQQATDASLKKQMYTVLKGNSAASQQQAERKSLLICGKAQALLAQQQQQHKAPALKRTQQHFLTLQQQQQQQQQQQKQQQQQQQQQQKQQQQQQTVYQHSQATSDRGRSSVHKFVPIQIKEEPLDSNDIKPLLEDAVGVVRRKHCNCSKSQCLKLYCDCFANGEFCQNCTCKDCFNNLQYEDERQRAIKICLERNPSAFKPKITSSGDQGDMRLHNKGCNCKRSGCLKNYCECYEAKIPCSSNCKCLGCRNIEERPDLDMDPIDPKVLATIVNASLSGAGQKRAYDKANSKAGGSSDKVASKALALSSDLLAAGLGGSVGSGSIGIGGASSTSSNGATGGAPPEKQQCNFITQEVVDATIQCMISQADECEKNGLPAYQTEKMVMEEMGRCLVEIIDFSIRNTDSSFTQD